MELDGEKVTKTYENEFWNRHSANNWMFLHCFDNNQTIKKINVKKPGIAFYNNPITASSVWHR